MLLTCAHVPIVGFLCNEHSLTFHLPLCSFSQKILIWFAHSPSLPTPDLLRHLGDKGIWFQFTDYHPCFCFLINFLGILTVRHFHLFSVRAWSLVDCVFLIKSNHSLPCGLVFLLFLDILPRQH